MAEIGLPRSVDVGGPDDVVVHRTAPHCRRQNNPTIGNLPRMLFSATSNEVQFIRTWLAGKIDVAPDVPPTIGPSRTAIPDLSWR